MQEGEPLILQTWSRPDRPVQARRCSVRNLVRRFAWCHAVVCTSLAGPTEALQSPGQHMLQTVIALWFPQSHSQHHQQQPTGCFLPSCGLITVGFQPGWAGESESRRAGRPARADWPLLSLWHSDYTDTPQAGSRLQGNTGPPSSLHILNIVQPRTSLTSLISHLAGETKKMREAKCVVWPPDLSSLVFCNQAGWRMDVLRSKLNQEALKLTNCWMS